MTNRWWVLLLAAGWLAGCAQAPAAPAATESPTAAATPAAVASGEPLVIMTHDSFSVSEAVIAEFERATGARVEILPSGDTGSALNKAILSKDAPLADVFFGVDNTFMSRALAAGIFEPYDSPAAAALPADVRLDPTGRLHPVDVGYVMINYDRAALRDAGLTPPATLEELADPRWRGQLIVQNPATSSPGLAFLLTTIAHFGEDGEYTWRDYWRALRANDVLVTDGWEDAYYTHFSGSSGAGPRPLVVSYGTSPAAEVYFSEGALSEPPTANLEVPAFRQIEFVGILAGTPRRALAERFVDFMLGPTFQADIPLQMWVWPAAPTAPLPEVFTAFATRPARVVELTPERIEAERERWIGEWTSLVLR